jgi:hypothetical protein
MSERVQLRPGRPFGLTLAILATTLMYSIMPLMQLGFTLLVMNHFQSLDMTMPWNGGDEVLFAGADTDLVNLREVIIIGGLGIAFLAVAILAWRGRPSWSRHLLFFGALGLNVVYLLSIASRFFQTADLSQGLSSSDDFFRSAQVGYLIATSLVTLYLVWYMNRAPARAFYRGYYLPHELEGRTA